MRLERITGNPLHSYSKDADFNYAPEQAGEPDEQRVYAHLMSFGRGEERTSSFRASLDWADVEKLIEKFSDMGHPAATELVRARKLASAVDQFCMTKQC